MTIKQLEETLDKFVSDDAVGTSMEIHLPNDKGKIDIMYNPEIDVFSSFDGEDVVSYESVNDFIDGVMEMAE